MVAITFDKRKPQRFVSLAKSFFLLNMGYCFYYFIVHSYASKNKLPTDCQDRQLQTPLSISERNEDSRMNETFQKENLGTNGRKHWCIIGPKFLPKTTREHFDHFPHTAEIVLPCWSYFIEQGAWAEGGIGPEKITRNCGFYVASEKLSFPTWPLQLIQAMGCEIRHGDTPPSPDTGLVEALPAEDIQHIPNLYLLRPRFNYRRYIYHPDHAHALRRLFIADEDIDKVKSRRREDGNVSKPLQIGMIQRPSSRRIGNFEDIRNALEEAIPDATITSTNFDFKTVKEQAEWFATKDVIIAAHGAAVINSVFITPGTIVMQLYPPGYFWESLEPLIEQSGGHAIQWYKKGVNPIVESATMEKEAFDAAGQGLEPFNPPVDEVVKPVVFSLGIETPTNKKLFNLYGQWV